MEKPRATEKNKIYWTLQGKMNYLCCAQGKSNCIRIIKKYLNTIKPLESYLLSVIIDYFCIQLAFVFNLQKDFYIVHENTDASFFFRKTFIFFTCFF